MKNLYKKHLGSKMAKVSSVVTLGYVSALNAAPVDLPATAQADIEGSATNGGNLYIAVSLLILGFFIIGRMIKRT